MALRVGQPYAGGSAVHWASLVADTLSLYEREGLDVEMVASTDDSQTEGLLSGDIPIIRRGPDPDVLLAEEGKPVRIIAGLALKPSVQLFARAGVTAIEELRGRAFAAVTPRFGSTLALRMLLADSGFAPSDYQIIVHGGTPRRLQALRSGEVDAALLSPPAAYVAANEGLVCLARIADRYPDFLFSSVQANMEFARREPEQVVKFLRALIKAQRWLLDPGNKDEAISMLAAAARISQEESRTTYEDMVERNRVFPAAGEIRPEHLRTLVDGLQMLGDLRSPRLAPEQYLELSYLSQAHASAK